MVVTKLSRVQTPLPITSRQASKPRRKSRKSHRNLVQTYYLDKASVMVIVNPMPVLAALAILLTYSCSAPIMMPWVQQWRSDAFSPALECQLILQRNWQIILLTGCRHNTTQKHHTKTTSASLLCINLLKKHVCLKPQPIYHLTMPIEQTIFVRCPDAKHGSISKGDGTGLTLNNKGEIGLAPGPLPASSSGTVVAAALLALADSSNSDKDLYCPVIHAPPGPCTNRFPKKAPTKTGIAAERMSIWAAIAILLMYSCSAPITLPWVQQWRADTFSPALERQSLLP